jgi:hypothetical protein
MMKPRSVDPETGSWADEGRLLVVIPAWADCRAAKAAKTQRFLGKFIVQRYRQNLTIEDLGTSAASVRTSPKIHLPDNRLYITTQFLQLIEDFRILHSRIPLKSSARESLDFLRHRSGADRDLGVGK